MRSLPDFVIDEDLYVTLEGRKLAFLGDPQFVLIEPSAFGWLRDVHGFDAPLAFEAFLAVALDDGIARKGLLS